MSRPGRTRENGCKRRSRAARAVVLLGGLAALGVPASAAEPTRRSATVRSSAHGPRGVHPAAMPMPAPRNGAAKPLSFAAADEDDEPFGAAAFTSESGGGAAAPGFSMTHAFYGSGARAGGALADRSPSGFKTSASATAPFGATLHGSVDAGERIVETSVALKRSFTRDAGRGRSLTTTFEVGWAHEARTSPNLRASFARPDSGLERSFEASATRHAGWANAKTVYRLSESLSAEIEQEADVTTSGRYWLAVAALRYAW